MSIPFWKMCGAGNDFVVVDNRALGLELELQPRWAVRLCERRFGIGADGLLLLESDPEYAFRMRYYNADGSRARMCGNGARCLAYFAWAHGIPDDPVVFRTDSGPYRASRSGPERVRLYWPELGPWRPGLTVDGWPACWIDTGTEHLVVGPLADVDGLEVNQLGPRLRAHPDLGPEGANVNFVAPIGPDALRVRTYERGVEAETLACGTGALAAALVAYRLGWIGSLPVQVHMPGGVLTVGGEPTPEGRWINLYLEGPVQVTFAGTFLGEGP
ncbi:MAG: diaminopimelate epimerase [Bacteroidetes bacterium]|nr:diaminopimelate epimerase [Rhodothermia bacterium]MCS7155022.1 diaminopimelate epimerase [Bacteroidota bacterium]MCX7907306.1 diaminopimelate epimerase [Bacteroidota bacterium]MDW8137967.1 diaminopimelate epimerase [Bacteroidota bacterium]MDW8286181.1 diaminopimelate epimerase [Bacteroidota bacterium]